MTYILRHGSYLHRSDQHIVEGLIMLVRFRRPDIYQLPLNIISDWRKALEADVKLEGIVELRRIVED